jgi:hypothetical protein
VVRLQGAGQDVTRLEVFVDGAQRFLDLPATSAIVVACGTIESTRLALESFATPLMGRNLVAHLRSNTTVRIKRSAFDLSSPAQLEAAALLIRGSRPGQRFHLQVTAAAVTGPDPEVAMFRMIPDIDLLGRMLASENADSIVITFRGIGEMEGTQNADATKLTGAAPSWVDLSDQRDEFGVRRAWVNLVPTDQDLALWRTMDDTAIAFAQTLAGSPANIEYFYNKDGSLNAPGASWHADPPPPSTSNDRNDPANKVRDGVGTTHHEAGTLWMGADPSTAVTDLNGRFHHRSNVYVAGPALFPALGSANPSLTALTLARRTASAIVTRSLQLQPGFRRVGNGSLAGWQMAGAGGFIELGGNIIESSGGIGLLWFTEEEFDNFVLRVEWRASDVTDNSGIFIRFPALGSADPANDWRLAVDNGYEIQIDDRGINPDAGPHRITESSSRIARAVPESADRAARRHRAGRRRASSHSQSPDYVVTRAGSEPIAVRRARLLRRPSDRRAGPVGEFRRRARAVEIGDAIAEECLRVGNCAVVDRRADLLENELQHQPRLQIADVLVELLGEVAAQRRDRLVSCGVRQLDHHIRESQRR